MTTLRDWKPFALTCLIAISFGQLADADEIIPIGRRRTVPQTRVTTQARRPTPSQQPSQSAKAQEPSRDDARSQRPQGDPLLALAERAIGKTSQRYLDADKHTPWQIMHGMVAMRTDFELTRGDGRVNCVEFISDAPTFRGEQWWQVTEHGGRSHPFSVPYAFEGHPNQFLALLSMSNLPLTHEFNTDGTHTVTMADMINNAKLTVNPREEITWTLWFLTHYIDIDSEWISASGEPWSLEKLVQLQTRAQVTTAACGGCHGLFAIAYARNAFLQKHGRLRGVYYQADQKINRHIELARSLQNNDGSFSTEFFKGPGQSRDFNERMKASGHMLEWLMMAMPQDRLREPWLRKAVASIATDLIHNASKPAECGPLYHALNSLIMYRDRVRSEMTPTDEPPQMAATTDSESHEIKSTTEPALPKTAKVPVDMTTPAADDDSQHARVPHPLLAVVTDGARAEHETAPADTAVDRFRTITPATPEEAFGTPPSMLGKTMTRSRLLTKKAARRLADVVRETNVDNDGPGLLPAPDRDKTRMAIGPQERVVR